jgi:tetratricopeptide (TPR) repeat protein
MADDEVAKARLEYRSALQIDEQLPEAWFGLAEVAERQQEWQQALSFATRAVEIDPNYTDAQILRAEIFLIAGEYAKALEITQILISQMGDQPQIMALHAGVLFRLGQLSDAIDLAERALRLNPAEETATLMLAAAMLQDGNPERALSFVQQGRSAAESSLPLLLMQVRVSQALGDIKQAEEAYLEAIAANPHNISLRLRLVDLYLRQFDTDNAERVMREVVDLNPADENSLNRLLALINQTKGIEAALAEIDNRIAAQPENIGLRFTQVDLLELAGDLERAKSVLEEVAANASDQADRHRASAAIAQRLLSVGKSDEALALADAILAEDPRQEDATLLRSGIRIRQRELNPVIADLRALLLDNPSSERALLLLAKAHELDGALDLADDMYDRAFESSDQASSYALAYAAFLKKVDRIERAVSILAASLQRHPKAAGVLTELADLYLQQGQWLEAEQLAQQLKQLEGEEALAGQLLSRVAVSRARDLDDLSGLEKQASSSQSQNASMAALVSAYVQDGNIEAAVAYLETVLTDDPDNTTAGLLLAQVFAIQGEDISARETYQSILQRDETAVSAYTKYARYLLAAGESETALEILEEGIQRNPESFTLRAVFANLVEQVGDYERAIELYQVLIAEAPNADPIANNLANLLAEHRTDDNSLQQAFALAIRFRQSPLPEYQDTLGWVMFRLKQYEDALPLLQNAVAGRPKSGIIRYHFAKVLQAVGNLDRAIAAYVGAGSLMNEGDPLRDQVELELAALREAARDD